MPVYDLFADAAAERGKKERESERGFGERGRPEAGVERSTVGQIDRHTNLSNLDPT